MVDSAAPSRLRQRVRFISFSMAVLVPGPIAGFARRFSVPRSDLTLRGINEARAVALRAGEKDLDLWLLRHSA